MHYDQEALYALLLGFQNTIGRAGIEITENDLLEVWRQARQVTGYFVENEQQGSFKHV